MLGKKKTSKIDTPGVVTGDIRKTRHIGRWLLLVVAILGLAFAGVQVRLRLDDDGCNGRKTSKTYDTAAKYLGATKTTELKRTLDKIEQIKNYDKDANCIYPFIAYYINVADVANAKRYHEMFTKVYDPKVGLATVYAQSARSDIEVKQKIELQEKLQKEITNNRIFFN